MSCMAKSIHYIHWPGGYGIYNFGKPILGHHFQIICFLWGEHFKEIHYFYIFLFQTYFSLECLLMEFTLSCLHIITMPFTKFCLHCHSSSWEDDVKARQPISLNYPSDPGKLISLTCVTKQSLNIFCMHPASWRNYNIQTNHISYMNFIIARSSWMCTVSFERAISVSLLEDNSCPWMYYSKLP